MVAHAAPAARVLGSGQLPAGLDAAFSLEHAGDRAAGSRDDRGAVQAGRSPTGNRRRAPDSARLLGVTMLTLIAQITVDDLQREARRLQHDYEFLTYGLIAAWVILAVYVMMMIGRQKKLKREIEGLRVMVDEK